MEDIQLSPEAQRQEAALEAATERMRVERLEIDAQNRALQALIEREEQLAASLQEFLDRTSSAPHSTTAFQSAKAYCAPP